MGIKVKEIPKLDCTDEDNMSFLIDKFENIKPVLSKGLSIDDFDIDRLTSLMQKIVNKKRYLMGAVFYSNKRIRCSLMQDEKIITTIYAKNLRELFMKIIVFCYYRKV